MKRQESAVSKPTSAHCEMIKSDSIDLARQVIDQVI